MPHKCAGLFIVCVYWWVRVCSDKRPGWKVTGLPHSCSSFLSLLSLLILLIITVWQCSRGRIIEGEGRRQAGGNTGRGNLFLLLWNKTERARGGHKNWDRGRVSKEAYIVHSVLMRVWNECFILLSNGYHKVAQSPTNSLTHSSR